MRPPLGKMEPRTFLFRGLIFLFFVFFIIFFSLFSRDHLPMQYRAPAPAGTRAASPSVPAPGPGIHEAASIGTPTGRRWSPSFHLLPGSWKQSVFGPLLLAVLINPLFSGGRLEALGPRRTVSRNLFRFRFLFGKSIYQVRVVGLHAVDFRIYLHHGNNTAHYLL